MGFLHFFLIPTFERVPVEHGLRAGLELMILPICLSKACFYHTQLPLLSTVLVFLLQVLSQPLVLPKYELLYWLPLEKGIVTNIYYMSCPSLKNVPSLIDIMVHTSTVIIQLGFSFSMTEVEVVPLVKTRPGGALPVLTAPGRQG